MTPEALAELHAAAFTVPRPWKAGEFASILQGDGVFVIGDARGFILGRAIAGEAELLTLAVSPDARRQGKARALLAAFLFEAASRGAEKAFLEVAEDNIAAIALYTGAGFQRIGSRRGYFAASGGERIDAVVMNRKVDAAAIVSDARKI